MATWIFVSIKNYYIIFRKYAELLSGVNRDREETESEDMRVFHGLAALTSFSYIPD